MLICPIIKEALTMNKTETAYYERLRQRQLVGEIVDFKFEGLTLKLVDNVKGKRNSTVYTPDFLVVCDDHFELHEVKGFWREDARLKIKFAAQQYPWFRFIAIQRKKGKWEIEEF